MSNSHLETLQAEIAAISGTPLAKAIGPGSGDAPVDLLKSHIDSFTRKDGSVVAAHDDKRVKKTKPSAVPAIHAHTDKIRALAESRKGNGTDDHSDMHYVADSLDKGDHAGANTTLHNMDTEPRDAVLDHVHPEHREKLGFSNIDKEKNIAKFDKDHPAPEKKVVLKKPKTKVVTDDGFPALSKKDLGFMESSLANDEDSSDDELVEHFVSQGIPEDVAKKAIKYRDKFMNGIMETGSLQKFLEGGEGKDLTPAKPAAKAPKFDAAKAKSATDAATKAAIEKGAPNKPLSHEEVNKFSSTHDLSRKAGDWSEGETVPADHVKHFPEFSHKEVYGHDRPTTPVGSDFHPDFAAKKHTGFVVKNHKGERHVVDTQGSNYARYSSPVDDKKPLAKSEDDDDSVDDMAKNLTGADLLKSHIDAYTNAKDKS